MIERGLQKLRFFNRIKKQSGFPHEMWMLAEYSLIKC